MSISSNNSRISNNTDFINKHLYQKNILNQQTFKMNIETFNIFTFNELKCYLYLSDFLLYNPINLFTFLY